MSSIDGNRGGSESDDQRQRRNLAAPDSMSATKPPDYLRDAATENTQQQPGRTDDPATHGLKEKATHVALAATALGSSLVAPHETTETLAFKEQVGHLTTELVLRAEQEPNEHEPQLRYRSGDMEGTLPTPKSDEHG